MTLAKPITVSADTFRLQHLDPNKKDVLPPFASLTNDDDRERKAVFKPAGTYNVVLNPTSFAKHEKYERAFSEDHLSPIRQGKEGPFPAPKGQSARLITTEDSNATLASDAELIVDPDIVVLKAFDEVNRRTLSPEGIQLPSKGHCSRAPTLSGLVGPKDDLFRSPIADTPLMRYAHPDGRDHQIIYHFKNFVRRHLAQVHRDSLGTSLETGTVSAPDVFENQAGKFLPLYHALMAFSAFSMSLKHGIPSVHALQHYQQAFPSLKASRTEEDLASDGVFLTHFILLLYEIAADEPRGLSLWSQHISRLKKIILLRRDMHGSEPYDFIIWWVACIDVHVVLSGMGHGEYVKTMLHRGLLPTNVGSGFPGNVTRTLPLPTENGALPSPLAFHRRICVLAAELGLLATDLRNETKRMMPLAPSSATRCNWQAKIGVLQGTLRRTWSAQMPISVASGYCNRILPVGARGIFEHSFVLYRALLIYSHTSMYPTQHLHHPSHTIDEVSRAAAEIIELCREIVASGHVERKFTMFPLLMAGFVNKSQAERKEILRLFRRLEEDSIGRNLLSARQLLEIVYEKQERRRDELNEQRRCDGKGSLGEWGTAIEDIDWVGMRGELGLQIVTVRL
ncbi:MAG: hypothetical protein Q9163_003363 [Psora crenata]